jgi:hypothetical protein
MMSTTEGAAPGGIAPVPEPAPADTAAAAATEGPEIEAEPEVEAELEGSARQLWVECPAGVAAGEEIIVTTADGQQVRLGQARSQQSSFQDLLYRFLVRVLVICQHRCYQPVLGFPALTVVLRRAGGIRFRRIDTQPTRNRRSTDPQPRTARGAAAARGRGGRAVHRRRPRQVGAAARTSRSDVHGAATLAIHPC